MFSINFNQTAEIDNDTRTFHNVHFVENDCSWTSGEGGMVGAAWGFAASLHFLPTSFLASS